EWEGFVIRGREGFEPDPAYGDRAARAVDDLNQRIARGEVRSFDEALDYLAGQRRDIAERMGDRHAESMGRRRIQDGTPGRGEVAWTPITGAPRYEYVYDRAVAALPEGGWIR